MRKTILLLILTTIFAYANEKPTLNDTISTPPTWDYGIASGYDFRPECPE